MDCSDNVYTLLFKAISVIPVSHYALGLSVVLIVILYNFLEFHLVEDLLTGFRGSTVSLTYNSCSEIYEGVASKCKILHGRYLATPWLSSPHIQTTFLNFFGRPPAFTYRRQLFHAADGGTIALDWLLKTDVSGDDICQNSSMSKDDTTPIMVVIPGLTSDSASAYLKHLSFDTAKQGWNVVISNHRGLGGISVTELCPTVEEFRLYLDCHDADEPVVPLLRECMWRILRARLQLSIGLARSLVANGNLNILRIYEMFSPAGDLTDHVFQARRLFAFCLSLLAAFLLVPSDTRVNLAIIGVALQLEIRRDISPLVWAETLLGLDQVRCGCTQIFGGSPLLLQMWLCDKLNVLQVPSGDWLHEGRTWARCRFVRIHDTVADWIYFLATLEDDDIVWRCHWLPLLAMTVSTMGAQKVVLVGLN